MKQTAIVNIYHFVRMSHVEPSRFIADDFETIRNEIILTKQHGFPGTYALKYDALMDSRYQALFQTYLDEQDEISAWWEITEPLCRRAGVPFRGKVSAEYDDRVDSAYCVGYRPEERKRLVDAYMADFFGIYGRYPQTIGSWVLDSVTLGYAAERYGILGGAICRDQMGTDGFTLWGGFPNGIHHPCRKNEFVPAHDPWRNRFLRLCSGFWDRIPSITLSRMCGRACRVCIPWSHPGSRAGTQNGFPGFFHCLCEEESLGAALCPGGPGEQFPLGKHTAWPWPTAGGSAGAGKPGLSG